jgi:Flp pilus assembly protein TadD
MITPITIDAPLGAELERLGLEFLADFYGGLVGRHPENLEALSELAQVFTTLGRHTEGLAIDEELARALPESPIVRYNLACSLCLVGRSLEALDALERAVSLGYDDAEHLTLDEDLLALHKEVRFKRLLKKLSPLD